jgi:hypothetical protein
LFTLWEHSCTSDKNTEHPKTSNHGRAAPLLYQLFLASNVLFLSIWRTSLANLDHITSLAAAIRTSVSGGGRGDGDGGTAPDSSSAVAVAVAVHELLVMYMQLWAILSLGVYTLPTAQYLVSFMSDRPDAASA